MAEAKPFGHIYHTRLQTGKGSLWGAQNIEEVCEVVTLHCLQILLKHTGA